ncbi:glycosyl hydrolase family 18 protein [Salirhabdus salicampi]|uniref:glycosyl hydrolase family 18 protein n=1 Tax=Salirhabdus salicampi TaxID=476102 RepID=UPI0020C4AA34|nr:glycosyl hydrolase family 18 protein [Salirhabdus salicampi]MCP8616400.1 glycosyl hydrolase family 18 protein [Salirhabdus salicampi]
MSRIVTHQRSKKHKEQWIAFSILGLFIISVTMFWNAYPFPSKEKVDYFTNSYSIVFEEEKTKYNGLSEQEEVYIPYDFIAEYIDPMIHYDEESSSVIVTTKNKVYQMPTERLTKFVNDKEHNLSFPVITTEQQQVYLELDWLQEVYSIDISYNDETSAMIVHADGDVVLKGNVLTGNENRRSLRINPDLTAPYVDRVEEGETVTIEDDTGDFLKVRKGNGIAGFMKKEMIEILGTEVYQSHKPVEEHTLPNLKWPIHVTWDAIYHPDATPNEVESYNSVQVLSPTWFHIDDTDGNIRSYASHSYVDSAKGNGYHVWALFSNDFNLEQTSAVLQDFETRQRIIRQLLHYADIYGLDGINIDFENVYEEDGPLVTQFVREFTPLAHEAGLIVSMDITFISNSPTWSKFYEREKLVESIDYFMVMAYDEHPASSNTSGSVASLPWVETHLEALLKVIPHDRLLLGVPFYTRLWTEEKQDDGSIEVSSQALTMTQAKEWIDEYNVTPVYDENTGQDYVEYEVSDKQTVYKLWLENDRSLQKRVELVHKYKLAGIASWSRYFANERIWEEVDNFLNIKRVVSQ